MLSLSQIEQDLVTAMKAKDQVAVETLRGLKTRIQNEKIAKASAKGGSLPTGQAGASGGKDLTEDDIFALIRSEVKRRKEAAATYISGSRQELANKELAEADILQKYLPKQMDEAELAAQIDKFMAGQNFTAKDFGAVMGKLKAQLGSTVDGAALAKLLKEKLKS